ncbi:YrdB family protein [Prolixibacter bellariivorans]|nr:YrdB family protein [Prolixibacter bellariivorans]
MNFIKQINLLVSFLLELGLIILAGLWGFQQGENSFMRYVFVVAIPAVIILLWGVWAAPKSKRRLKNPARTIFKLAMMALAVFFAYASGHLVWALSFAVITILNVSLAYLWKQDY